MDKERKIEALKTDFIVCIFILISSRQEKKIKINI